MILLVLLFIGISIFFLTFDLNTYKGFISSKISTALGRQITIDSMAMKLSLIPTVEVKGITIANTKEFQEQGPLLKVDSMDVTLALIPLLKGSVELQDFNLSTANIILIDQNGQNNYTFVSDVPAEPKTAKTSTGNSKNDNILERLSIDKITIKKLTLSYTQEQQKHVLSLVNVSVEQLKLIKATIVYNGKTVKVDGNLGNLAGLVAKKPNYSFQLAFDGFDAVANVKGTIGDTANFAKMVFNVSVEGKNLKQTAGYFSKTTSSIPPLPFNLTTVIHGDLSGDIKIDPVNIVLDESKASLNMVVTLKNIQKDLQIFANGSLNVKDESVLKAYRIKPLAATFDIITDLKTLVINKMTLVADKSEIIMNGTAILTENVPTITTQIVSQYFDIDDFMRQDDTLVPQTKTNVKNQNENTPLFSDDKIDLSALRLVNATVALTAHYIKMPQIDNIGLSLKADLKDGHLKVPSLFVRTPIGALKGGVDLNASSVPANVTIDLTSDEIKLDTIKEISSQLKGSEVWASVKMNTTGDSVKSFVSHLNGQITLELTEGEILNKWFNSLPMAMGLLKNKSNTVTFSTADQVSQLVCGAINLTVKDGVIRSNEQIAIETSVVNFLVSGDIDLPKEELSLTMEPSISDAKSSVQNAMALTQIVKISGPFRHLTPSVDTKKAAEAAVKGGLGVLANKIAEKQGLKLATPSSNSGYNLCEKVLGRPLTGQTAVRAQPATKTQAMKTENKTQQPEVDAKDVFKQQLFDSLTKALKK